jgi:ubiquinone/menaquinone biosynthesis C-methylase UbiE
MNRKPVVLLSASIGAILGGGLLWRWISTREQHPCPPWLSILLENPYMNTVASTETILNRLEVKPGMQILDVGCGPGRLAIPAARRVGPSGQVTALDVQAEMLRRAREKAVANQCDNIRFIHAAIGAGALPAGVFDRAILVTVLGEVLNKDEALAEIFATLKPGGILSITEVLPDPHYQTYGAVNKLTTRAGFVAGEKWRRSLGYTAHFIKPDHAFSTA